MGTPSEQVFRGVLYHIRLDGCSKPSTALALRRLLDEYGAKESDTPRWATRIITDTADYSKLEAIHGSGVVVTAEWVYSSIEAGVKRPYQYYLPAPTRLLSGVVVSPRRGTDVSWTRTLQFTVTHGGGQWLDIPTAQTTHCISESASEDTNTDLITMSPQSFCELVARKGRLPHPSHCIVDGQNVSRAHFFCHALLAQKTDLNVDTEAHVTTVSNLPQLPYEVVSEIFLTHKQNSLATPGPSFVRSLLKITHICGRWRLIAHHTRELWMDVHLDFHSKRPYRRLQNIVTQWVERSSPRGLSVHVRSIYSRAHNPAIDFLLANSSRIRTLHLELPEPHFLPLLRQPAGTFTLLEKLTLRVLANSATQYDSYEGVSRAECFSRFCYRSVDSDEPQNLWSDEPITVFQNSPRLHTLFLDAWGMFNSSLFGLTSWNNLIDIDFGAVDLGVLDVVSLLPMFTNARRLIFSMDNRQGSFMPPIQPVALSVEEFSWCGFRVDDTTALAPLVLPRLTSLDIREGAEESLFALQSRSAFKLNSPHLTFYHLTFAGFSSFLRNMSSLTVLQLYQSLTVTDKLLKFLVYNADTSSVFPQLERLELVNGSSQYSECVMMCMVGSRWIHTPLVKVRMKKPYVSKGPHSMGRPPEHSAVLDWVVQLVEEGLEFAYCE